MLDELEPLEDYIGVDCRHKSVFNILKYKGLSNFQSVWKQCGLFYRKSAQSELGLLRGRYLPLSDELKMINNIITSKFITKNKRTFLKSLIDTLYLREPIMIYIDTYNFKYNQYYQQKHMIHTIILTHYENGRFSFVDDTFFDTGSLSREELVKAAWITRNNDGEFHFLTFSINEARSNLYIEDYLCVIHNNNRYIEGGLSEAERNNLLEYQSNNEKYFYLLTGVESIKKFISEYRKMLNSPKEISDDIYNVTYINLMEISNCHYRYADFLKSGVCIEGEFQKIIDLLTETAQEWKISSNMMLKSMYKKDLKMFHRMLNKVEKVIPKELEIVDLSYNILKKYTKDLE